MKRIIAKARLILQGINTYRLKSKYLHSSHFRLRSGSDNGIYPELALKAALDPALFSVFRRHNKYLPILEHVSRKQGEEYLQIIREEYNIEPKLITELASSLNYTGQPVLHHLQGLAEPISTTALRYIKVALDIKSQRGHNLGHIVEIGCGFGGQAIILDKIAHIDSYTFIDLWQVNMLIRRFIEASDFSTKYSISTIKESTRPRCKWDLAISNYAFSELPGELQNQYINEILINSEHGYMTMNSGPSGEFMGIKNWSQENLKQVIPHSYCLKERPLTNQLNYIIAW